MARVEVRCATCGQKKYGEHVDLPKGYALECERCRTGTPGKPMKQVRNCSLCREPIIVMGLSGGVRLTCSECAKKDPKLVEVEAVVRDRDKIREKLNDVLRNRTEAETELEKLRAEFKHQLEMQSSEILRDNEELRAELVAREENSLAARVQAKMRMKYGESEKQRLRDFAEYFLDVLNIEPKEFGRVDEVVDEFCEG